MHGWNQIGHLFRSVPLHLKGINNPTYAGEAIVGNNIGTHVLLKLIVSGMGEKSWRA